MSKNLYILPQGWEWKKLEDLSALITKGSTPTTYGYKYVDKGINFIKIENISDGKIQLHTIQNFITEEAHQSQKRSILQENDILFSIAGTIGESCIVSKDDLPANTNQALAIIRLKQDINPHYARLLLSSEVLDEIRNKQRGGALKNISLEDVKNALIPLPPLEEQRRIVGVLDGLFGKIDKSIALLDESIASASSLMPSALNEVFEELGEKWGFVKVENLCTKITDGTHATPKYIDIGIPFLSVKDITNGKISFENTRYISQEEHEFLSRRCHVEKNDILYTKVGTTGVAKVVDVDIDFSIFVSIALLKPIHSQIQSKFFEFMLNSPNCYEQAQSRTRGVANRNLVLKDIKEIFLPLPPLDIQTQTVAYLDALHVKADALKKAQEKKKEALLALKASLLESAFKGAL